MKIFVLSGPNLNRLGEREPEIYGTKTLDDVRRECEEFAAQAGFKIEFRQTNEEGQLVLWLQEAADQAAGAVLNPAAFTHYSLAVRDAVAGAGIPVIEIHISNIWAREEFRHTSVVSPVAAGVIAGLGTDGYVLALQALARMLG